MTEQTDEISTKPEAVIAGVRQVASAVLAAPAASAAQASLAIAVLEATSAVEPGVEPREHASIAATFNAHMDAVLDAANASRNKRERVTRRALMARAIDQAGLVLMDRSQVAGFFHRLTEQDLQLTNYDRTMQAIGQGSPHVPADVASALRFLEDHMQHASPEHALQWQILRDWMTPDAVQPSDVLDATKERGGHVE